MNSFKMTTLAAAMAATLVAAPTQAAIDANNLPLGANQFDFGVEGVGELFVSIVARGEVASDNRSYVRDLGITANTFVGALNSGTLSGLNFSIAPDALLTSFLAANAGKAISFNLTAVHNPAGYDPVTFDTIDTGFLTTSREGFDATASKGPQNIQEAALKANPAIQSFIQAVNLATDGVPGGNAAQLAQNLSVGRAPGQFGFHDNNFGGSSTFGFNTEGAIGGSVDFYFLGLFNEAPQALSLLGNWSLANDGTLSFAPVPLPAAAWMLGSGVIGLAGLSRRRRKV